MSVCKPKFWGAAAARLHVETLPMPAAQSSFASACSTRGRRGCWCCSQSSKAPTWRLSAASRAASRRSPSTRILTTTRGGLVFKKDLKNHKQCTCFIQAGSRIFDDLKKIKIKIVHACLVRKTCIVLLEPCILTTDPLPCV